MALVWKTTDHETRCDRCEALEGKRDGDGWSSDLPPGETDEGTGPPPLHPDCKCEAQEETAAEWKEGIVEP